MGHTLNVKPVNKELTLYIEDWDDMRNRVLKKTFQHSGIMAPSNIEECIEYISKYNFTRAVIDLNLSEWFKGNQKYIRLGDNECHDGIQVTSYLFKEHKSIKSIRLFSSNESDLEEAFGKSYVSDVDNIKILYSKVRPKSKDKTRHLVDYFKKFHSIDVNQESHTIDTTIYPLYNSKIKMTKEIESFFCKKILSIRSQGEYLWKAGKFSWLVNVNKELSEKNAKFLQENSSFDFEKTKEEYRIFIDKEDYKLQSIYDKKNNYEINIESIKESWSTPSNLALQHNSKSKLLLDLTSCNIICNQYLNKEIGFDKTVEVLQKFGATAILESQRLLYTEILKYDFGQINSKEDIYKLLEPFSQKGFPKILDVFNGRVDSVNEEVATIKLESCSPENPVLPKSFKSSILDHYNLEEDSEFMYIVYIPEVGGKATYLEPK